MEERLPQKAQGNSQCVCLSVKISTCRERKEGKRGVSLLPLTGTLESGRLATVEDLTVVAISGTKGG